MVFGPLDHFKHINFEEINFSGKNLEIRNGWEVSVKNIKEDPFCDFLNQKRVQHEKFKTIFHLIIELYK